MTETSDGVNNWLALVLAQFGTVFHFSLRDC